MILWPLLAILSATEETYKNTERQHRAGKYLSLYYNKFHKQVKITRDYLNSQNNFIDKKLKCVQVDYNTENVSLGKNIAFLWFVSNEQDIVAVFWKAFKVYNKKLERILSAYSCYRFAALCHHTDEL